MVSMEWVGVDEIGYRVNRPGWHKKDVTLTQGYKITRRMKAGDVAHVITCSILADNSGMPTYQVASGEAFTTCSNTPGGAMTAVLKHLGLQSKKKWSGVEFFGLRRVDVCRLMKDAPELGDVPDNLIAATNTTRFGNSHVSWVSLVSLGIPELADPKYKLQVRWVYRFKLCNDTKSKKLVQESEMTR